MDKAPLDNKRDVCMLCGRQAWEHLVMRPDVHLDRHAFTPKEPSK